MLYHKPDLYKLNIQLLHFSKKKRGRFPADLITLEDSGKTIEDYVPNQITRTNCTSIVAHIWDIQGLLAPLMLKLKHDLRSLLSYTTSWTDPIPDHQRSIWIENFKIIEETRDILYVRCKIPEDAVDPKVRLLFVADAADPGIITAVYATHKVTARGNKKATFK